MKIVQILIRGVIHLIVYGLILFIALDLLFSDFGPGESSADRLLTVIIFFAISGGIVYLLKKYLPLKKQNI